MKVHHGLEHDPGINCSVVTTGTFDGVHIGHQVIINRINELAKEVGGESVLITFHPHPRKVLYPDTLGKEIRMINTQREKIAMLATTGLDHLVILPFTLEFAKTSSEDFIRKILTEKLKMRKSVVGFNHYFGFQKQGNYDQLFELGQELGFEVEEIPEQDIQNETVSSTKIRKAIEDGNIQRANAYLNHILFMMGPPLPYEGNTFSFGGHDAVKVEAEESEKLMPPEGMYAVRVKQGDHDTRGVAIRNDKIAGPRNMLIIPVDPKPIPTGNPEAQILFYKQLLSGDGNGRTSFEATLKSVAEQAEELIY